MENKKIVITPDIVGKKDITLDFSNIQKNKVAQEYLLKRSGEVPREKLFEEIYQNRQSHGVAMMEQRASRRNYQLQKGVTNKEPSYLDTVEKERNFYDLLAREDTRDAMNWLETELQRRDKSNHSLHLGKGSH